MSVLQSILLRIVNSNKEYYTDTDGMIKLNQVIDSINELHFSYDSLSSSAVDTIHTALKNTIDQFNSFGFTTPKIDYTVNGDIMNHLQSLIDAFNSLTFKVRRISPLYKNEI